MMGGLVKEDLAVAFDRIEDPRIDRQKKYPICEIIFLALCGALVGIESWRGLELYGEEHLGFLQKFFKFDNGIPSHQTIGRVFSIVRPQSFEQFFMAWSAQLHGSNEGKQIAFDGKSVRGAIKGTGPKGALHLLNAFAVDHGITLAQLEVDAKTNEITTLPEMIDSLDIKGAMVSVDALNTQKDIAEKIIDAKADYTLALKGNHKNLNEEIRFLFDTKKSDASFTPPVEKGHGRISSWTYDLISLGSHHVEQIEHWKGLVAVGRVGVSTIKGESESSEQRFYLLSYTDVERFAKACRGHWGIENRLHWVLDVCFGEDASAKRKDHAPRNYSLIRKLALNIIRNSKGSLSVRLFQIKAISNHKFFETVLLQSGFKISS